MGNEDYQMTLSLNVINHLGLNLYSNVPAVISEAVANSWDADANEVVIEIDQDEEKIKIIDDGWGMDGEDVNDRYLNIGYRRRKDDKYGGDKTPDEERPVMGRKGIGKLSLFSVAETVKVFTKKEDSEPHAFEMNIDDIKEQIKEGNPSMSRDGNKGVYEPKNLIKDNDEGYFEDKYPSEQEHGTLIILTDLKKGIYRSEKPLRKRLARRFSILGDKFDFSVKVNGEKVDITERDYFHKIDYLWEIGDTDRDYEDLCDDLEGSSDFDGETPEGHKIKGWIGSVSKPSELQVSVGGESEETDNLNKVPLLVRGKMAKEDVSDLIDSSKVFKNYLCGEIHADFLDSTDMEDITTTAREDFVRENERYEDFARYIERIFEKVSDKWEDYRKDKGKKEALGIDPIDTWFEQLSEDKKEEAEKLFKKINKIPVEEEEKAQVFKYSVLAFEKLRFKDALNRLEDISSDEIEAMCEAFVDLEDLEAALYHQITKQRLEVIDKLVDKVDENELEKVLQEHIFNNLWLLDPSWERATGTEYQEKRIYNLFEDEKEEIDTNILSDEELRGRVDLKYRHTAGQHVIIELKRADRKVSEYALEEQVDKYRKALRKILKNVGREDEGIEVVCIIGEDLKGWDNESDRRETKRKLKEKSIRIVRYDELIDNAQRAYRSYFEEQGEMDRIQSVLEEIEQDLIESE